MNAIAGLPSLPDWEMILNFDETKAHSKAMHISFSFALTEASTGLKKLIDFSPANFVQPKQQTYLTKSIHYYSRTHCAWYY